MASDRLARSFLFVVASGDDLTTDLVKEFLDGLNVLVGGRLDGELAVGELVL